MGIGGAMMWPAILGMTFSLLPKSKAGLAGGLIMGAAGFGNAFGPLLGGVLTDTIGWRWVFFLNLPIAIAAVVITYLVVRPDGERQGSRAASTISAWASSPSACSRFCSRSISARGVGWTRR